MKKVAIIAAATCLLAGCGGSSASRSRSTAAGLTSIGAGLQGPTGLVATVYARGLPDVAAFAFDPQGRLWVATAAYTDTGADGVYLVARSGATPLEVVRGLHTAGPTEPVNTT